MCCRKTRRAAQATCKNRSRARNFCARSSWPWPPAKPVDCFFEFCLTCLMQIESLKVFCDLAETESFTKAAQINSVTQSAVSQQISSLERIFKSLLIERSKKKFRLTREGQVLYEYSKKMIQTYDSIHNQF